MGLKLIIILAICASVAQSANIFGVFPIFSKSHYVLALPLLKELAKSGHNLTVITLFKTKNLPNNFREILIELPEHIVQSIEEFKEGYLNSTDQTALNVFPRNSTATLQELNSIIVHNAEVQDLMNSDIKFDLMMMEVAGSDTLVGFAHYFKVPVVGISTVRSNIFVQKWTGTPVPPSYLPFVLSRFRGEMTFLERVQNTLLQGIVGLFMEYSSFTGDRVSYNTLFPDPKPSFYQAKKNAMSLVLMNSHVSLDGPQPLMSNIIEVSGMHLNTKLSSLPKDLQEFLDKSKQGVIYFCLGSNIEANMIPQEKRDAIINVLNQRQENIVIKWNHPESLSKVSKNKFYSGSWLPQADILNHPNVKAFVTHGGLGGILESIYFSVPTVGIPIFADQHQNVERLEDWGIGVKLTYVNLTESSFSWALNEVLDNTKYRKNVDELSIKFRDRPQEPLETAKFWVEYVIRHKGAKFLRSPALALNCLQYENLDVYGFLIGLLLAVLYMIRAAFRWVGRKVCSSKTKKVKRS